MGFGRGGAMPCESGFSVFELKLAQELQSAVIKKTLGKIRTRFIGSRSVYLLSDQLSVINPSLLL
jgi:hypothetical protein